MSHTRGRRSCRAVSGSWLWLDMCVEENRYWYMTVPGWEKGGGGIRGDHVPRSARLEIKSGSTISRQCE